MNKLEKRLGHQGTKEGGGGGGGRSSGNEDWHLVRINKLYGCDLPWSAENLIPKDPAQILVIL